MLKFVLKLKREVTVNERWYTLVDLAFVKNNKMTRLIINPGLLTTCS